MTSQRIAIVRHGETNWNLERRIQGRTEIPLNDTGRVQARATGRLLGSAHAIDTFGGWQGLFSSPLGRAIETAQIMAGTLSLADPLIEEALYERDFGDAEGMLVAEAHERWPGLHVPGAETLEVLADRTAEAFDRLLGESPGSIVVAHGAMIRAGLSRLSSTEIPRILNGEVWILEKDAFSHRTYRFSDDSHSTLAPSSELA